MGARVAIGVGLGEGVRVDECVGLCASVYGREVG